MKRRNEEDLTLSKDYKDAVLRFADLNKRWRFLKSEGEKILTFFDKTMRLARKKTASQRKLLNSYHKIISLIEEDYLLNTLTRQAKLLYEDDNYTLPANVQDALKTLKAFYIQLYKDASNKNIQVNFLLNTLDRDLEASSLKLKDLDVLNTLTNDLLQIVKEAALTNLRSFDDGSTE